MNSQKMRRFSSEKIQLWEEPMEVITYKILEGNFQ